MNTEEIKIVKSDEAQQIQPMVDKSRRSFSKAGLVAPVILTLANKTALGATPYHCTVSGQQSGNHSGNHDFNTPCNVGFSPGAWKEPLSGNGDGSLDQWLKAGAVPFDILMVEQRTRITCQQTQNNPTRFTRITITEIKIGSDWHAILVNSEPNRRSCNAVPNPPIVNKKYYIDSVELDASNPVAGYHQSDSIYDKINASGLGHSATKFSDIFGGSSTDSLYKILNTDNGSLDFHAIADWLNAGLNAKTGDFSPVYDDISQSYIVKVYQSSMSIDDKKDYFILIHH